MIDEKELENRFTYHAPRHGQAEKYEAIRYHAKVLAAFIVSLCPDPDCRELDHSLTSIDMAVFWANAAIARRTPVSANSRYLCTVCGKNAVDAAAGFDTCPECVKKI